jgi:hypothetical protein
MRRQQPSAKHLMDLLPPEEFAAEVLEIERELTQLHPPWREPLRSRLGPNERGIVGSCGIPDDDIPRRARGKYLLQRRKYLYDGKNLDVVVLAAETRNGRVRMAAGPVSQPRRHYRSEDIRELARAKWPERAPLMDQVPAVCQALGLDGETVRRALIDCPATSDPIAHVRQKLGIKAPPPRVSAAVVASATVNTDGDG